MLKVITDQKLAFGSGNYIDYFQAEVISYTDYYLFGAPMDNGSASTDRNWQGDYRYGFNGKEKDNQGLGGGQSTYDYGFRIYNAALGKFLSVDPLFSKFPYYSPFHYCGNKPVSCIDLDGREDILYLDSFIERQGEEAIDILSSTEKGDEIIEQFQNTDPNKFGGKVNIGYDAFIFAQPLVGENELASTTLMFEPGFKIRDIDENGQPFLRNDGNIAVMEALDKKDGSIYERLSENFPKELLDSDQLRESLKKGKGIILISINSSIYKLPGNLASAGSAAGSVGHEFGSHTNNISQGIEKSREQEHLDFAGTYSEFTVPQLGSEEQVLQEQISNEVKERK